MRLMPALIPRKQQNRRRNRDVARNEVSPIEWLLESSEALDEQNEDIQEQIESVYPDRAPRFEGIC